MEKDKHNSIVEAAAIGAICSAVLIAALTIVGEEWAPLKNWLKGTFMHHWLGKSALAIVLFVLVTIWQQSVRSGSYAVSAIWYAALAAVLSSVAMTGFFVLHFLRII